MYWHKLSTWQVYQPCTCLLGAWELGRLGLLVCVSAIWPGDEQHAVCY